MAGFGRCRFERGRSNAGGDLSESVPCHLHPGVVDVFGYLGERASAEVRERRLHFNRGGGTQ